MMSVYLRASLVTLFLVVSPPARANFVINGGFETGYFTNWVLNDPSLGTFVSNAFDVYVPHTGQNFAALGASGQQGSISQSFVTNPGTTYTLDFFLASDGFTPNEFKVIWDGATVLDRLNVPVQGYVEYKMQLTATKLTTTLEFAARNDNGYLSLDDISLNAVVVPEPTSMISLGIGALALAGYKSYRRELTCE